MGLLAINDIYKTNHDMEDYSLNMDDKSKHKIIWSNGIKLLSDNHQFQEEYE